MTIGSTTMHEIICTHCSKTFKVDEVGYADILKQVSEAMRGAALAFKTCGVLCRS